MGPVSTERVLEARSPEETHRLGLALGRLLEVGDFIGLAGPLGAGKTVFVRGVAEGAGVSPEEVSSPTFAIVQPYAGRVLLHHADLYRLDDAKELYATGYWDLVEQGATVVEWIDRVPEAMPLEGLRIELVETGSKSRALHVRAEGDRAGALLRAWTSSLQ